MKEELLEDQEELNNNSEANSEEQAQVNTDLNAKETDKIQSLEQQLAEQKDKYLRLFAEFDNYKKRSAKDKVEYMSSAGKPIILSFISIMDDFDRAKSSIDNADDVTAVKEGVDLIYDKMNKTLKANGVEKIDALGQPFDVELHEAITEIPVEDPNQKGKVMDVLETGYTLNGKVLRFAKVVVGK